MRVTSPQLLGAKIQQRMASKAITQESLAAKSGVSQGQVSKFVRGDFKRLGKNLIAVLDHLDMDGTKYCDSDKIDFMTITESLSKSDKARFAKALRKLASVIEE